MRFENGDGSRPATDDSVVWERKDFLAPDFFSAEIGEGRSLFDSLSHLLDMRPVICLLFLLAAAAAILAKQPLTAVQMLTIAAGYALYFPLMLYLSSRFSFSVALVMAVAGWNRGMVLLWLGVVTLAVLINLQNRALKRKAAAAAAALVVLAVSSLHLNAADVQVTLPAELVTRLQVSKLETINTLVAF